MLSLVPGVCGRQLLQPAVSRWEFGLLGRLWLSFRLLRRGAVAVAISGRRTYRCESVRCRACCARRGHSGAVLRRGFRRAARVGGSSRALRPRAAIFPAFCAWTRARWPTSLVARRRAPRDAFGTEDFPAAHRVLPSLRSEEPRRKKRLTMALQRTAPRVTVAAILVRESFVRVTFFRSSYALSSFHLRSYRAALRSL